MGVRFICNMRIGRDGQVESEATGRTTLEGVYAAGDDVRGADLIVTAIAAGRQATRAMDEYLRGLAAKRESS